MRRFRVLLTVAGSILLSACSQKGPNPFIGRWDLTLTASDATYPGWLELSEKDGVPEVRVQPRTGNVRPAPARMEGSLLVVTLSPASDKGPEVLWELNAQEGKLSGVQKRGGEPNARIAGERAPDLKREAPAAWSAPEPLFNGKDLTGWEPINNTPGLKDAASHWVARKGELVNEDRGSNLRTTRTFDDFKLHIEFNCPEGENSGVYLRGRYEAQVTAGRRPDAPPRRGPATGGLGAIYGYLAPAVDVPGRPPGEWQVYDITLVGRAVTVVLNGMTTLENQEIAGITGGALDSKEGEPGPIYLQGDHHGGVRYRNITISLPQR
ncbi:MAG: DUF1080 domain-containing protein [Bryobacterales bacterium]|nr:DUF1080 domain-containing protein [Bryobacterales bacterium]